MQIVVRRKLAPGVSTVEIDELAELVAHDQLAARVALIGTACGLVVLVLGGPSYRAVELACALFILVVLAARGFRVRVALERHRVTVARSWLGFAYLRHELDTSSVEVALAQGQRRSWRPASLHGLPARGAGRPTSVRVGSTRACSAIAEFLREQLVRVRSADTREAAAREVGQGTQAL